MKDLKKKLSLVEFIVGFIFIIYFFIDIKTAINIPFFLTLGTILLLELIKRNPNEKIENTLTISSDEEINKKIDNFIKSWKKYPYYYDMEYDYTFNPAYSHLGTNIWHDNPSYLHDSIFNDSIFKD
jgi:hypothetical protein